MEHGKIIRKIGADIRRYNLLTGLALGLIIGLYSFSLEFFNGIRSDALQLLVNLFMTICLTELLFLWKTSSQIGRIRVRIRYLENNGTPIDAEHFVRLSDELSYGENWLVYHVDTDYRFWHRYMLAEAKESENDHPEVRKGILEIYSLQANVPEAVIFTKNGDIPGILSGWIRGNDNLNF